MGWRGRTGGAAGAVLAMALLFAPARAASPAAAPALHDAAGIHVVQTEELDARQLHVKVWSAALGRAVDLRILVPTGYSSAATAAERYPVLYLFHGTSGRASDWVDAGDAEATTAPLPVITVMPDAGFDGNGGSWFTDWFDPRTHLGPSKWETFHVRQLIPWVDANFRTVATREGRAVAGLSQGGFGAMTYAARHPDTFVAVASFSGAPEIDRDPEVIAGATAVIEGTALGLNRTEPEAMFGSRATNEINWKGHDPGNLVTNLRGMSISLWTANGSMGPYDTGFNAGASGIEYLTHVSTDRFHRHLVEEGIPSSYHDYGAGTHTWAYWTRDLKEFVEPMMRTFASPPRPASIDYRSVDQRWTQWGWTVDIARGPAQQFSRLSRGGPQGFVLEGTGTATVTTPPAYAPASRHVVSLTRSGVTTTAPAVAGSDGRLRLTVPLGGLVSQATTVLVR